MENANPTLEQSSPAAVEQDTIAGAQYRVTRKLGAGGMGAVYAAEHSMLGRVDAVKVLLPELSTNVDAVDRFFNEAKAATAINHPGIVKVYDSGQNPDGSAYIVMELLDGEDLEGRLARVSRLPVPQALRFLAQISSTLKAAHNHGIVHRDLKPGNIFLVPDPQVAGGERIKLLDFGIAKIAPHRHGGDDTQKTRAEDVLGTPLYMAPEQCRRADQVDQRSDLYSLGCILYEMLCGQPPFTGLAPMVIAAHLRDQPVPPSQLEPGVSPELEALVLRLLAKDPSERYQSADELEHALRALPGAPASLVSAGNRTGTGSMGSWLSRATLDRAHRMASQHTTAEGGLDPTKTAMIVLPKRRPVAMIAAMIAVFAAFAAVMLYLGHTSKKAPAVAVTEPGTAAPERPAELPPPPKVALRVKLHAGQARGSGRRGEGGAGEAGDTGTIVLDSVGNEDVGRDQALSRPSLRSLFAEASLTDILSARVVVEAVATLAVAAEIAEAPAPSPLLSWKIRTAPAGATVIHEDGRVLGITPLEVEFEAIEPEPGARVDEIFTLSLDGYEQDSLTLRYDEDFDREVGLVPWLERQVVTVPPGATVFDSAGQEVGTTPWVATISREGAPRVYSLQLAGHEDQPLTIVPDQELPTPIVLEPYYHATLTTEPPGADVVVTGTGEEAQTPYEITLSKATPELALSLSKDDYEPVEMTVRRGDDLSEAVALVPLYAATLRSRPEGAEVYAGATRLGQTPYELSMSHEDPDQALTLRLRGYEDEVVSVRHGDDLGQPVELVPLYVATVRATERGVEVYDQAGQRVGRTPYELTLARGDPPVSLTLRKRGYADATIEVRHGADLSKPIALAAVREISLRTRPEGVRVHAAADGRLLGTTPGWRRRFVEGDPALEVILRHPGYAEQRLTLGVDAEVPGLIRMGALVTVTIESSPPGARVIDEAGKVLGTTPWTGEVSEGRRPLRFTVAHDDYVAQTVRIRPTDDVTRRVALVEVEHQVELVIDSSPRGAVVYDGRTRLGRTPHSMVVRQGAPTLRLELRRAGYANRTVRVQTDGRRLPVYELEPCVIGRFRNPYCNQD
ncbi:serine/threonine-protein kinase [Haliangium sp.]|uniref:serine/threonine-protein kinase n=1 Tax=Haliangium sp. TaxID=2663208 RepID=UPI003D0CC1E6